MIDDSRDKLDFALFCSKHPNQRLTMSHNLSEIHAQSAHHVNIQITVHPCIECKQEMNNIKWAIRQLKDIQKIDLKEEHNS